MTRLEALAIAQRIREGTATEDDILSTADLVATALTKGKDAMFDLPLDLLAALRPKLEDPDH